jgi:hypothetical protein
MCLFFSNTQNACHFVLEENLKMTQNVQPNGKQNKRQKGTARQEWKIFSPLNF